jgi:hypothetical protein
MSIQDVGHITDVRGFLESASFMDVTQGIRFEVEYTASLEGAKPAKTTLTSLLPEATTGSLYLVGSGSETWLCFKGVDGVWRTVTSSIAA